MKYIFYYSDSIFPYAGIAAAMHLGVVPGSPPYINDFVERFFYVNKDVKKKGRPYYAGTDHYNNHIYAVWNAGSPDMVYKLMLSFLEMYGIRGGNIYLLDTGLKDTSFSKFSCMVYEKFLSSRASIMAEKVIQRNYSIIRGVTGKSSAESLTKNAAYQIMLP